MDQEVREFLDGLVHGPCANVTYAEFAKYCEREARRLLESAQQSVQRTACTHSVPEHREDGWYCHDGARL